VQYKVNKQTIVEQLDSKTKAAEGLEESLLGFRSTASTGLMESQQAVQMISQEFADVQRRCESERRDMMNTLISSMQTLSEYKAYVQRELVALEQTIRSANQDICRT